MLLLRGHARRPAPRPLTLSLVAAGLLALSTSVPTIAASGTSPDAAAGNGPSITRGGLTVAVPPRGMGVRASALMGTGEVRALQVETGADGQVVVVDEPGAAPAPRPAPAAGTAGAAVQPTGSPSACSDSKKNLTSSWWHTTFHWMFKSGSKPSSMTTNTAELELKRAMRNITRSRNDCGRPDEVSATAVYEGRTTRGTHIGGNSSCTVSDNHNVVAFGNLSSSTVGFTCWWYSGSHTVEADVQLNKSDFNWAATAGTCFDAYIVRAVATHEFGHVFGLGHVSQGNHANLTMSTAIYPCDDSDSSLGLGDTLGLEARY